MKKCLLLSSAAILFLAFAIAGCGGSSSGGSHFTSSYVGCWQGTWTKIAGFADLGGTLNITVAGDGSWTGVLTLSTGDTTEPTNICMAVSGTSDNTSMTTSFTIRPATDDPYSSTFNGTFIPETGHMKGTFVFTTTESGVDEQTGSFDLTPNDCPYQGHWEGTWNLLYSTSPSSGSLNLVIAKDGSINGTKDGSSVSGIVTKDSSNEDVFTMNPYNPSDGSIDLTHFIVTSIIKSSSGELKGTWTCLDDEGSTMGTGGFTLQQ